MLNLEFNINYNKYRKTLYEDDKKDNIIEKKSKNDVYKNTLINYIKNTKDASILNDEINDNLNSESSFINPNLSIKNARSTFIVQPIDLNPNEKIQNKVLINKFEKSLLKKIK